MKLNFFKNHLSLVKDFDTYCHVFQYTKRDHLFSWRHDLTRHLKTCRNKVCETFPGGIYETLPTVYEKLDDIGISIPPQNRHFPFLFLFRF